jgi:hypothetical protein
MNKTWAVLVGVANPQSIEIDGSHISFNQALGVNEDITWYETLLTTQIPPAQLSLNVLTSPTQTAKQHILQTLSSTVEAMESDDTIIFVLCGHGFQITDKDGDETGSDLHDEVFAASDGPIRDDEFGHIWTRLPPTSSLVVFADTCSADSIGIFGGTPAEEIVIRTQDGPSMLGLSASTQTGKAGTVFHRNGSRGVMSLALENAWTVDAARRSYQEWFREAADRISLRRPQQHPVLRYLAPNDDLLERAPLR